MAVFHTVSAFNNGGFALHSDSLMRYVSDPWICLPLAIAVILGGLGYPVLLQLRREFGRPLHWTMNTRIVLLFSGLLLFLGAIFTIASEWSNRDTLGPLSIPAKFLAGFTHSVMSRSAGYNSVDTSAMDPVTWLGTDVLMFVGRLGPITLGTALVLRRRTRLYERPKERPIIG